MPKYHIDWQKTYYETGEFEVEADSEEEARALGLERMKTKIYIRNDKGRLQKAVTWPGRCVNCGKWCGYYYADDKDKVDVSQVNA